MSEIRAKFKVDSKKETLTNQHYNGVNTQCKLVTVELTPVSCTYEKGTDGSWLISESENTKFWKASPSGKLDLGCINLEAANALELGKEYYIDFTPAN